MRSYKFSSLITRIATAFVLLAFSTVGAVAQETGKVQGRVIDAATGQPLVGAQIVIDGTNLGSLTSEAGYYFINAVPAGVHDVRAIRLGYRTTVVSAQRVLAGQTLTLNFELEPAAVEIEPLVVQGERNPLVPRDQVASKTIVTGEAINQMPVDNASAVIELQAGVVVTNEGTSIRGSRANLEAVYVDGVLVRSYSSGDASVLELPTNALEQIDVTTGGVGVRYAEARSGVVNYVTKSGGPEFSGTFSTFSDQLGPPSWRTGFNRMEFTFGGPILPDENLTFFVAGVAEGRQYDPVNSGYTNIPIYVTSGIDSTFTLAASSAASGAADSVVARFPSFTRWDNGRTLPFDFSDEYTGLAKVSWGIGTGSRIDFSYKRDRDQGVSRAKSEIYNPQGWDASFSTTDVLTLNGYFMLTQSADEALALDVSASWQRGSSTSGVPNMQWVNGHKQPFLGFNFSSVDFLASPDDWEITDALVKAVRSGAVASNSLILFPQHFELSARQSLPGLEKNLRANPYGMRRNFSIGGFGNGGLSFGTETRWMFSGVLDWQMNRFNRLQVGGDFFRIDARRMGLSLFSSGAVPSLAKPIRAGLFVQDRLDLGDVIVQAGLRWDYFDPNGEFPRVPGFVHNVPDSMKADFVTLTGGDSMSLAQRITPLVNCGAGPNPNPTDDAQLYNSEGEFVCKDNFIEASTKSAFSPFLGVSFPVTDVSTFRLSYSHHVRVPALLNNEAVAGQAAFFENQYRNFGAGTNTNDLFGRDVDLPRTVLFEAGYRQLIGGDLVLDVSGYFKNVRNDLTYRSRQYIEPPTGSFININVLTNAGFKTMKGFDIRLDKRFGQLANLTVNYGYVDAAGTGSDPQTYVDLIKRQNTNLFVLTGIPPAPPDVMLPLLQSRTHNFSGALSLQFPADFAENTPFNYVLGDLGVFATARVASGLPYTRLINRGNGQTGPPTDAGLGGSLAEALNSSSTPWERRFDLRLVKGFEVSGTEMRIFADWRNPLGLTNVREVYLETGTVVNSVFRERLLQQQMADPLLDDDTDIDSFDIKAESPENAYNIYSLLQAEKRFGNGDGTFTVEEQKAAFGAWYELFHGPQNFRESNQSLRLGVEIAF